MRLSVITCSQDGYCPVLARSLMQHSPPVCFGVANERLSPPWATELICEEEKESIAKAYNRGAVKSTGDILVFTHSDVENLSSRRLMGHAMNFAHRKAVGVLGVAGTRVLSTNGVWWDTPPEQRYASGACMHKNGSNINMSSYGPYGRVAVLDGVFLMMRREVFVQLGGFNEARLGFHFYDLDLTLRAHLQKLKNYTFQFHLLHHSVGKLTDDWWEAKAKFVTDFIDHLPASV